MSDRTIRKIAIVGGGVSGISTLIELVRAAQNVPSRHQLAITLFNKSPETATGLAYSKDLGNRFLLNHEMTDMGGINVAGAVDNRDFFNWVQEHRATLQPSYPGFDLSDSNEYVPRNLYGKYLTARYTEAKELAHSAGIHLQEIVGSVTDVNLQRKLAAVDYQTADEKKIEFFDKVVLAMGHSYAERDEFSATGQYFKANDVERLLQKDLTGKTVAIQGTGQYADEIALAALDAGAEHVSMISRHGLLHAVRGPTKPYERQHLTIANLEALSGGADKPFHLADVMTLLKKDMEEGTGAPIDWREIEAPKDPVALLKERIEFAKTGQELKWRSVLLSLKDIRQEIYERLTPEDRTSFNVEHRALFFTHQAPIPLKIATKLLSALESGKLDVRGGWQTKQWFEDEHRFTITHARKGLEMHDPLAALPDKDIETTKVDYLVAANGQTLSLNGIPLLKKMQRSGTLESCPAGGVAIDTKSHHTISGQGQAEQLYALGPIVNGSLLISSNAGVCMQSAKTIAASIMKDLELSRTSAMAKKY